jgi:hypothetical protein
MKIGWRLILESALRSVGAPFPVLRARESSLEIILQPRLALLFCMSCMAQLTREYLIESVCDAKPLSYGKTYSLKSPLKPT